MIFNIFPNHNPSSSIISGFSYFCLHVLSSCFLSIFGDFVSQIILVFSLNLHAIFSADEEQSKVGAKAKPQQAESSPNTSTEEPKAKADEKDQGTSLKRAYSLSDLNKPNVPRRILPAPPANGKIIFYFVVAIYR